MNTIRRFSIETLAFPVSGYRYLARILISVDGGQRFYYCGISKYARTQEEAADWFQHYEEG